VDRRAEAAGPTGFVPMHLEPLRPSRRIQSKEHRRHLPTSLSWRFPFDAVVFGCFLPAPQNQLKRWREHGRRCADPFREVFWDANWEQFLRADLAQTGSKSDPK
jgi:hypothetical protein